MTQSYEKMKDEDLVNFALNNDKEAYGVLFERYKNLVYRRCLMMLGNCDMALDALQDSFLTGYRNLERLNNPEKFSAWVAGIARYQCLNIRRRKNFHSVSLDYLSTKGIEPENSSDFLSVDEERMESIKNILPKLPRKQREAIELYYIKDNTLKEIADFLDDTVSAVKSRLFHARKKIIWLLEKEGKL
mgnify:FL=1